MGVQMSRGDSIMYRDAYEKAKTFDDKIKIFMSGISGYLSSGFFGDSMARGCYFCGSIVNPPDMEKHFEKCSYMKELYGKDFKTAVAAFKEYKKTHREKEAREKENDEKEKEKKKIEETKARNILNATLSDMGFKKLSQLTFDPAFHDMKVEVRIDLECVRCSAVEVINKLLVNKMAYIVIYGGDFDNRYSTDPIADRLNIHDLNRDIEPLKVGQIEVVCKTTEEGKVYLSDIIKKGREENNEKIQKIWMDKISAQNTTSEPSAPLQLDEGRSD